VLELGLEGPGLHSRTLQPLKQLHEHFEEERGEAGVLGHTALWGQGQQVGLLA
jgi:hypothetical protein